MSSDLDDIIDKEHAQLHAENAQLKAELAQAKRCYDGAVAAHHEAKRQYRDLIESHKRELAGWEAAHRALDNALATATQREAELIAALELVVASRDAIMKYRKA